MIEVSFLSYDDLKDRAATVLGQSKYGTRFPVDIEMIVEGDFEIEIIPIVGLQTAYQIDAFISKDLRSISVDESVFDNRINRYRFSLAHELGHRVLHSGIFADMDFGTTGQWKELVKQIPEQQYRFLEYQANTFANALLVPQAELDVRFRQVVARIQEAGLDPKKFPDVCLDSISTELGKQFEVSQATMSIRLEKEHLIEQL